MASRTVSALLPVWGSQGQADGVGVTGPLILAPWHANQEHGSPALLSFSAGPCPNFDLHHAGTVVILHGADPFSPALPLMSKRIPGMAVAQEGQRHHSLMAPWAHRPHDFPMSLVMFWGAKRAWEQGAPWKSCVWAGTVSWKNDQP